MKKFKYVALNPENSQVIREEITANNEAEVESLIESQNYDLVTIEEIKNTKNGLNFNFGRSVSLQEKVEFARQLSLMLRSGISIIESLDIIKEDNSNKYFTDVISGIQHSIKSGSSLSKAFKNHPKVFDTIFVSMIEAGEQSGNLEKVLDELSAEMKRSYRLKKDVTGALIYPAVIIGTLLLIGLAMFIFVVPKVAKVYERLAVDLPLSTKVFLVTGNFLSSFWWLVIPLLLVIVGFIWWGIGTKKGGKIVAKIEKKIPVVNQIYYQFNYARFTRILGILLKSGIQINNSVELSADSVGDEDIRKSCHKIAKDLEGGESFAVSMRSQKVFPTTMVKIVEVGEKSGKLDNTLLELSSHYTEELKDLLSRFTSLIEPILIVFIGIAVGVMVVSLIGPIYGIIGQVQ
jgi:type IV pilus assembly protein PilC